MVGSHHVEASAAQSFTQGITVGECLYGRVALYAVAKAGIVAVVEPQVMHAHLGCDMLLLNGRIAEKRQLALGREVEHVQARATTLGKLHGTCSRYVTGFGRAD